MKPFPSFGLPPLALQPFNEAPQQPHNPMDRFTPEQLAQMFQPFDEQERAIQQQMAYAQALRNKPAPRHTTGIGGALGALGQMFDGMNSGLQQQQAKSASDILLKKKGEAEAQKFGLMQALKEQAAARAEGLEREKMAQQDRHHGAGVAAAAKKKADDDKKALTDFAEGLRKEYTGLPEFKAFKEVESSYSNVRNAAAKPSAAGDLSLVFGFMKMLDPGSSVREGEFANAAAAAGLPERMVAAMKRVDSGQILTPDQRKDFVSQAETLFNSRKAQAARSTDHYRRLAKDGGVNPDDVALMLGANSAAANVATPPVSANGVDLAAGDEDAQAIEWAKKNPDDPDAKRILQIHGVK